jgi:hypothetical protein
MSAKKEDFLQSKWRPMMAWMYMVTVTMDMVVFPVVWSVAQVITKQPLTQWQPLTLQGAGLYHMAMGAILGVAAYGRTQEKIAGASVVTGPTSTPSPYDPNSGLGSSMPSPIPAQQSSVSTSASMQQTTVSFAPVSDPTDPPPMSSKMAERLARFKK